MSQKTPILNCKSAIPGGFIALMLSYAINKSIFFAIMHMFLGWIYVAYWLFTYTDVSAWINSWVVH